MVWNVKVQVRCPVLGVESDHLRRMVFLQGPRTLVPYAPHESAAQRQTMNTTEENDCQGGALVPLEHADQCFLQYEVISLINTARITPCPIEPGFPYNFAEHLQLVVSRRPLQIVHDNIDDLSKQRFVVFPLVRKRRITVVISDLLLDTSTVNVRSHG